MRSDDLRKIVNTIWRMFGIVLLVGALPNLALGIGFAIEELSWQRRSVATTGVVVERETKRSDSGSTLYRPIFEFTDSEGETRRAQTAAYANTNSYAIAAEVPIRYDPADSKDPTRARIATWFEQWFLETIFGGIGAVMVVIGAPFAFGLIKLPKPKAEAPRAKAD
ncbi:MAG: DUF3592 domain-containing protein [Planctomycetota bacterium]